MSSAQMSTPNLRMLGAADGHGTRVLPAGCTVPVLSGFSDFACKARCCSSILVYRKRGKVSKLGIVTVLRATKSRSRILAESVQESPAGHLTVWHNQHLRREVRRVSAWQRTVPLIKCASYLEFRNDPTCCTGIAAGYSPRANLRFVARKEVLRLCQKARACAICSYCLGRDEDQSECLQT